MRANFMKIVTLDKKGIQNESQHLPVHESKTIEKFVLTSQALVATALCR